jgi:high-affinity iron transporter
MMVRKASGRLHIQAAVFVALIALESMAWAEPTSIKVDALLLPLERAYVQAASGEWTRSLDLLEQFSMRWHLENPAYSESTGKVEPALNAAARALLSSQAAPAEITNAFFNLSRVLSASLSGGWGGEQASPQFFAFLSAIAAIDLGSTQDSNIDRATSQLQLFDALWILAENVVHMKDRQIYTRIEADIDNSLLALKARPVDLAAARSSLADLLSAAQSQTNGITTDFAAGTTATPDVPDLLRILSRANNALATGKARDAFDSMQAFIVAWPLAERKVKARSQAVYTQIDNKTHEALGLLFSGPSGQARAAQIITEMSRQLSRLDEMARYDAWDVGMTLLREGMEALLVLAVLVATLRKAAEGRREAWAWTGAVLGLFLSGVIAVTLSFAISAAAAGNAREQLKGFVGLASVALMVTVGASLHRGSNRQSQNAFIKNTVAGSAVASVSTWSIFLLAFLAVLREGADSIAFYIGLAPVISSVTLLQGIGGALLVLVVFGYLIIRLSVRLPLRNLLLLASILIYYLAFKITGESIHSLQIASMLPIHASAGLPSVSFLGMFATWETFGSQITVLLLVLAELIFTEFRGTREKRTEAHKGATGVPVPPQ